MNQLDTVTVADLEAWIAQVLADGAGAASFEQVAQLLCRSLYERYPRSVVLARCYLTVPLSELPSPQAAAVRELAEAKDIAGELHDDTPVISLVGTAGRKPAWNDRRQSRQHQAIPMVSASFIDAIPMMSRLMRSLGGDLGWIDSHDPGVVIERLGAAAGSFYVADARTELDTRGRRVISAEDFVDQEGVVTVFGNGGAFPNGQIFTVLVFCSHPVPRAVAATLREPMLRWKGRVVGLIDRVFDEPVTGLAPPPRLPRPAPTPLPGPTGDLRADRLSVMLDARSQELDRVNRLYSQLESALEERTRSLHAILDAASDGFLLVELDGTLCGETNAAINAWFGPRGPRAKLWDYLFDATTTDRVICAVAFLQIADRLLPFEIAADQMIKSFVRGGRSFALTYRPVQTDGELVRVLVVVRDVSAELEASRAEQRARELHAVTANMLRDRRGFARFVEETGELLSRLMSSADVVAQRRDLHTLKGTTAVYGLQTFAALAHQLEAELAADPYALGRQARARLHEAWRRELAALADLTDLHFESTIEITARELDDLIGRLRSDGGSPSLITFVQRWRHEPVRLALGRLAMQARRVGEQAGKPIDVSIVDGGLRLPLERTRPIWSALVHVIRNSVDHGFEGPERRAALGKPKAGQLTLASAVTADQWTVTVSDDGAGIDWDEVRRRAQAAGVYVRSDADLAELLFRDGFTTRDQASELSGRGVGLSALRAACRALGGDVLLDSRRGQGTTVQVALPIHALAS